MAKTTMKDLAQLKKDYEAKLRESGQEIMKDAVKEFFAANPLVKAVTWTQYTPYFADGDPCEFGVNETYFTLNKVDTADVPKYPEEEEGFYSHAPKKYADADVKRYGDWAVKHNAQVDAIVAEKGAAAIDAIEAASSSFRETVGAAPEDLFLAAFGDHVQVVLTPDEIVINDIDHD